jgi:adenylate cyclase
MPQDRRKLVAVLYADMVGYSRLIGLDDAGTLQRLRHLRGKVIDPAIDERGGRIVQTGGDSLLVVFDSIDGAVRCAVTVQQQVPVLDGDQPPDRAIRFRIGINIGDAIPDGTDLHGDAVNVAVRLQAECPPGGICVSRSVRDHVHGRLGLEFEELGPLSLKNIARPVVAFLLRPSPPEVTRSPASSLVGEAQGARPLSERPSVAVLPFVNLSADPEQEYFSDGVADDILTELSRDHGLFVIARNSSFTYRGRSVDVKQVGRELGVRYLVEGSVRRSAGRVRVTAQLIDARVGNQIWADRYDRDVADVIVVQDEIATAITCAVRPAVTDAEQSRALRKAPENLGAWEAYQRGLWYWAKGGATEARFANDYFQQAAKLDPLFASPRAMLAFVHLFELALGAAETFAENVDRAEREAQGAVNLDSMDASAIAASSWVLFYRGNLEAALMQASKAVVANQNDATAHLTEGNALLYLGRPTEARAALLKAIKLSPRDPFGGLTLSNVAVSHYFERNYLLAAEVAESVTHSYPNFPNSYRWLAAALGQLGRIAEAEVALKRGIGLSASGFRFFTQTRPPWLSGQHYEHMLEGLRKAGWEG